MSASDAVDPQVSTFRLRGTPSPTWVRIRRVLGSTLVLGVAVALATWKIGFGAPLVGIDPSWHAGLNMATHQGFDVGDEIVWTSGPLGFLGFTYIYYGDLSVLAFLYQVALHLGFCLSLLWVLRARTGAVVAVIAVYLAAIYLAPVEQRVVIAAVWCFAALSRDPPSFVRPLVVFGGAVFSAVEILIKVNPGLTVFALCAITVLAMDGRRRNVPAFAATFGVALLALWFGTGQGLGNIGGYLSGSAELVSGYSEAMGFSHVLYGPASGRLLLGAVAAVAILVLALLASNSGESRQRRAILVLLVVLIAFPLYKEAFLRSGAGPASRSGLFYWTLLGVGLAALPVLNRNWIAGPAISLLCLLAIASPTPQNVQPNPFDHLGIIKGQAQILFSGERRDEIAILGRAQMRQHYQVDQDTLDLLRGHTVHVDPSEAGVVWAYDLDWDPLPVFQDYTAYTESLDQLNADGLSSPNGPERILRENTPVVQGPPNTASIDERFPAWDPPAAAVSMLCNFKAVRTTLRWQVLARVPDRCGDQRLIGSVDSEFGSTVLVPDPPGTTDVVLARVHGAGVTGFERLRTMAYRAKERYAVVNGTQRYRLVPGTVADGLLVESSPRVDFIQPFSLGPGANTIQLEKESGSGDLRMDFYAMNVRPVPKGEVVRTKPIPLPTPTESVRAAQERIADAIFSGDCNLVNELNPLSRPEYDTTSYCQSVLTLAGSQVVGSARYRGGAVIDYASEGRIVSAVLIVDSDGLYHIATLDPNRTEASVGSIFGSRFDQSAQAAIAALSAEDCDAFLEVGLRRLAPDQSPEILCPYVANSPLRSLLVSSPRAKPKPLGGNAVYGFYRLSSAEANYTIVMVRQSDADAPPESPPLLEGAPEYAYFDAFLTDTRAPVTPPE